MRGVVTGGDGGMWEAGRVLEPQQQGSRLSDAETISRSLCQDSHEPQLCNRAGSQRRKLLCLYPRCHPVVELVMDESECHERIHVEKVFHGKFARISSTSLLLRMGASAPALSTGRPVTGSEMILACRDRS